MSALRLFFGFSDLTGRIVWHYRAAGFMFLVMGLAAPFAIYDRPTPSAFAFSLSWCVGGFLAACTITVTIGFIAAFWRNSEEGKQILASYQQARKIRDIMIINDTIIDKIKEKIGPP